MSVKRFFQVPLPLVRIGRLPVALRDFETQMAKRSSSFDLKLRDGLVHPAVGDKFIGPNGMSLRPRDSEKMKEIVAKWKGEKDRVYHLYEGMVLPEGLVILHEHSDHYSLQTTEPCTLPELNAKITELLEGVVSQEREDYLRPVDEDDQDN